MKKRIVCLTLALLMSATQVVSVSASREDELREEQAITSQQLDATYSRMDELAYAKSQLENEISELDSNLVSVMVSIDTLKGDIDNKEVDIIKTKQDLAKAQKAAASQGGYTVTGEGDADIDALVLARGQAKKAKDFAKADQLRDQLKEMGVEVTDVPGGAVWKRV